MTRTLTLLAIATCGACGFARPPDVGADGAGSGGHALTSFSFQFAHNPGLLATVDASITGTTISAELPFATAIDHLVATFEVDDGAVVVVGDTTQTSGQTANDFSLAVSYVVTGADGESSTYSVSAVDGAIVVPAFAKHEDFATGQAPVAIAVADLNGDGILDVVAADSGSSSVSVLVGQTAKGAATATFAAKLDLTTGSGVAAVEIADINGDGKPDIVTGNGMGTSVSVLINTTATGSSSASFAPKTDVTIVGAVAGVAVGDLNGDGKLDVVTANIVTSNMSVRLSTTNKGAATPTFASETVLGTSTNPNSVAIGDLDGDGKPDVVLATQGNNGVSVFMNRTTAGSRTAEFADRADFGVGGFPTAATLADIDGDGRLDVIVVDRGSGVVTILPGRTLLGGPAMFAAQVDLPVGSTPVGLAIGALNPDVRPDVVTADSGTAQASVLLGTTAPGATTPTFAGHTELAVNGAKAIVVGDVNRDDKLDIITAGDDVISVLLAR